MHKTFRYRLYPTKKQSKILHHQLEECRWLYNHLLERKIKAYKETKISLSLYDTCKYISNLAKDRISLKSIHSQVLRNVADRIDKSFQAFFRRVKAGEKPGFPRFKAAGRYDSMTFQEVISCCDIRKEWINFEVRKDRLRASKIGSIKIVIHRKLEGTPKTCTLKRSSTGKWYAYFQCEIGAPIPLALHKKKIVGIDVGLTTFATLSNNTEIKRERFFKKDQDALGKAQRKLSKEKIGSPERAKRRKPVSRIHERIKFRRMNFCHQWSRKIINKFGYIFVEDLTINRMVNGKVSNKDIYDVAWNLFFDQLFYKAAYAGRIFVKVNPAYTSQTCSGCGHRQDMPLDKREFRCANCPSVLDRDYNASLNILALGLQSMGMSYAQNPSSLISAKK